MAATERTPAIGREEPAQAAIVGPEATGSGPTPDQPPAPKPQKELLCTICNLRACWETPDAPAVTS